VVVAAMSEPRATFTVTRERRFRVPMAPNFVRDAQTDEAVDVADLSQDDLRALADAMHAELFANVRRRRDAKRADAKRSKK
jgi:hypothetical protein